MKQFLFEGTEPQQKDFDRINSLMAKAGSNIDKALKMAILMNSKITDEDKRIRRHAAAEQILGPMHPVTKAFENSNPKTTGEPNSGKPVLEYLKTIDPTNYDSIVRAFKFKGLNFESCNASQIQKLTSAQAFKYGGEEGDKYFKVWMIGDEIAFCTWANTMIDDRFKWNHKGKGSEKRDYSKIIGTPEYINGYFKSNSFISKCDVVYMIPFTAFGKAAVEMVEDEKTKYLNSVNNIKDAISSDNINFDIGKQFVELRKYATKLSDTLANKIENLPYVEEVKDKWHIIEYGKININFKQSYGDTGVYGVRINHFFWVNLSLPDLSYGTYDWDGITRSENASYDYAKKELKDKGIKTPFATDAKKVFKSTIAEIKKIPEYQELIELFGDVKSFFSNETKVKNSLRDKAYNEFYKYGFTFDKGYLFYNHAWYYLQYVDGKTFYLRRNPNTTKKEASQLFKFLAKK